jgi:RHS repeat-associated protein
MHGFPELSPDAFGAEHYNYFRDYDPGLGRYIQSDPIGLKGGFNTFGYVSARPIQRVDKRGLFEFNPTCFDCRNDLESWRREIGNACKRAVSHIKDAAMLACVLKHCEDGKIGCDGPHCKDSRKRAGYQLQPDPTIQLCSSNFRNFTGNNQGLLGCVAIHEWGHSCGVDADHQARGLGLPGEDGEIDPVECVKWR